MKILGFFTYMYVHRNFFEDSGGLPTHNCEYDSFYFYHIPMHTTRYGNIEQNQFSKVDKREREGTEMILSYFLHFLTNAVMQE